MSYRSIKIWNEMRVNKRWKNFYFRVELVKRRHYDCMFKHSSSQEGVYDGSLGFGSDRVRRVWYGQMKSDLFRTAFLSLSHTQTQDYVAQCYTITKQTPISTVASKARKEVSWQPSLVFPLQKFQEQKRERGRGKKTRGNGENFHKSFVPERLRLI